MADRAEKSRRDRREPHPLAVLAGVLAAFLLLAACYVGYQALHILFPQNVYETALPATVSDNVEADGVLLFDEVYVSGSGTLGYLAADGERVSAGTAVAEIYSDASQAVLRQQLTQLTEQIDLLQRSQNTTSLQLDALLRERSAALYDMMDELDAGAYDEVSSGANAYLLAQNKLWIATGDSANFTDQVTALTQQAQSVQAQLGNPTQITAPQTGYFVRASSSGRLNAGADDILAQDPAQLKSPWYKLPAQLRPEAGLLKLRKSLGLFANIRPAYLYDELKKACPLRDEVIGDGFDMVIMRELTGGLYFGERHTEEIDGVRTAVATLSYNENEIRRIAIKAFDIARKRKKHVISVDKANVLDSSRLWRTVVEEVAKDYEDVTYEHMLVDNCAMQLVNNPRQFDVILTENMFGDILSDEASMITGSIGMLSSASLAEGKFGLYEPSHGSAPDIAGQDIANPIATILSAAMMLRYSFDLDKEADEIEKAVKAVLADGYRTVDIMSDGMKKVGCKEMGQLIIDQIK